ncbi:MAG: hypothetical protein QOJ40_2388 [Verrucomicrobiota bacterium]
MTFVENFVAAFVGVRPFFDQVRDKGFDEGSRSEFLGEALNRRHS